MVTALGRGQEGRGLAAAVQGQAGAADVRGPGRGQELAGTGHVLRGGHTAQRDADGDRGRGAGVAVMREGGIRRHEARDDGVHSYLGRPLDGQAGDQVVQAGLGGAVGGGARGRAGAAHAADHDDRPAVRLFLHHRVGGLRHVQRCDQVQLDDLGVEPRRRGGGRGGRGAARVADHHVDTAELLRAGLDDPPRLVRIPDVRASERGGPVVHRGQGSGLAAGTDHDLCPGAEEPLGDARPDAPGAAGHDHPEAGKAGKWLVDGLHGAMLGSRPSKR
jgi:hypothetical protein